jgi:type II secretory pathway pseudopilin PulG
MGRRSFNCRPAFTLVELMVALALIIFIMTILSAAFTAAGKSFRDLKAAGDLAEKLRAVMTLIRRDLAAPHFDLIDQKLSDVDFWNKAGGPPQGGFFRIWMDTQPVQGPPGIAGTMYPSTSVIPTFVNTRTMLHFTVVLPGLGPNDVFSTDVCSTSPTGLPAPNAWDPPLGNGTASSLFKAPFSTAFNQDQRFQFPLAAAPAVPPTAIFNSPFAEVTWWLTPTQSTPATTPVDNPNQAPQQMYTLHRRYRLLWPENNIDPTTNNLAIPSVPSGAGTGCDEVSTPSPVTSQSLPVNRMFEASIPAFRLGMLVNPSPYNPAPAASPSPIAAADPTYPTYGGVFPPGQVDSLGNATYPVYSVNGFPVDIVLDGVLSFDVRVLLWDPNNNRADTEFRDLSDPVVCRYSTYKNMAGVLVDRNPLYPTGLVAGTGNGPWVFDTWSQQNNGRYDYVGTGSPPNWNSLGTAATIPAYQYVDQSTPGSTPQSIRILAIQVTLRLYDFKSQTTRQVTMVQNM